MANRVVFELVADTKGVIKSIKRVEQQAAKAGTKIEKSFLGKIGSSAVIKRIAAFGAAFIGFNLIRRATNNLLDFTAASAELATILPQTEKEAERLNAQLIRTSQEFGTTATAQVKLFYQIVSAGITDAAQANTVLIASNKLAIGGLTSTASAVDIVTSVMNSFTKQTISASRATDILFTTVKLGKTTVSELASSLGQILPSANAVGVSFEDISAALATLTTRGVSTSEAITQLNAVLTAVLKKQDTAAKMGRLVAEAFSLQALRTKGLTNFLKDLNTALGGSETKLVKLLGRAEGARAILTLGADGFRQMASNVDLLTNSQGAADIAFQKVNRTLGQQIKILTANYDAAVLRATLRTEGFLLALVELGNFLIGRGLDIQFLKISIALNEAALSMLNFRIRSAEFFKEVREGISSFNALFGFKDATEDISLSTTQLTENIRRQKEELALLTGQQLEANNGLKKSFEDRNKSIIDSTLQATEVQLDLAKVIKSTLPGALVNGFASIGTALAKGENAFQAFGNAIGNILGDLMISVGTNILAQGVAIGALKTSLLTLNPATAIAAGGTLIALGAALKALSGGGGGGLPAAGGGQVGGVVVPQASAEPESFEDRIGTQVSISIDAPVDFDRRRTGLEIAEILEETFNTNGSITTSVA